MRVLLLFIHFTFVFPSHIPPPRKKMPGYVQKCCNIGEILIDNKCGHVNETTETEWEPLFMDENGRIVEKLDYVILNGIPSCGNRQAWEVYHKAVDKLRLLPDGTLRHYIVTADHGILDEELSQEVLHYDYRLGFYCGEKVFIYNFRSNNNAF